MHIFSPNHVKLLNTCYPPTSGLLAAGPDYSPNSHELSRLTYYASNHPGKLAKIGSELEKRLKLECKKAKSGNIRSRASLLISLSIFRSLASECRRDIALLSPSLIGSVEFTLASVPTDLEVVARGASVYTAWTTFTNGHLIGADSDMTTDYLSILRQFALLSYSTSTDQETQNRTRLIGLAALTAAVNSEALYNDIGHFGTQASIILRPIMTVLFDTPISVLDQQASAVKDTPSSPYLAEFRTRPALERRAASIHVHVDGDKGPSTSDVSDVSLHALFSLLNHANGAQLGYIMQSTFDNLDDLQGWSRVKHCCWFAQKTAEWAQYQYRYVVPTWLVERLLSQQEATANSLPLSTALTAMITSVFSSPTPLINLSSSDILSNLLALLLRNISTNPDDLSLPALVQCISSLGCHVYYSDQIQDLAGELISRLLVIEVQGVLVHDKNSFLSTRSSAIRHLLGALLGLIRAANGDEGIGSLALEYANDLNDGEPRQIRTSPDVARIGTDDRPSGRASVPPDIWQDTLSLICDADPLVRNDCAEALVYYISHEMPKHGEHNDLEVIKLPRTETPFRPTQNVFPDVGDAGTKFLNSVHAYLYILALSPSFGVPSSIVASPKPSHTTNDTPITITLPACSEDHHDLTENTESLVVPQTASRRSFSAQHGPRARKESLVLRLLEKIPSQCTSSPKATEEDHINILKVLTAIHRHLPMHALVTGIPMLLALSNALDANESNLSWQIVTIKTVIAQVWLLIGQIWKIPDLVTIAERATKSLASSPMPSSTAGLKINAMTLGIDSEAALSKITSCRTIQNAFGTDQDGLARRLAMRWTPELALRDFERVSPYGSTFRGDGVSPLLKISPALMHIENISLQSLARSTRGLGVTDLREALEGRSSMSNPALVRPPSISTLDRTSPSYMGGDSIRLTQTRSRPRTKSRSARNGTGDVRDVLTRLGISKQNSSLLKATFPTLQKSGQY